jgi:uncharacterized protein YndB with AHSA1/START domain
MNTIEISYDINRSPDKVFAFLTDFAQLTRWRTLDSLSIEPAGPIAVGKRVVSAVTAMGRTMAFTHEITKLNPSERTYSDHFVNGAFPLQSSWRVEPKNGGSRLLWTTQFEGRGIMKLMTPLMRANIRKGQLNDLGKLKTILEEGK